MARGKRRTSTSLVTMHSLPSAIPCSTKVRAAYPAAFPPPTMTYLQINEQRGEIRSSGGLGTLQIEGGGGGGRGGGGGHVVLTPGSHWRNWRTPPPRGSSGRKTRPDENRGAGWRAGGQETEGTRGRFRAAGWKFQVRLPSPATSELLRSKSSEE